MARLRDADVRFDTVVFDFANTLVPLVGLGPNVFREVLLARGLDPEPALPYFDQMWERIDPHLTLRGVMARASSAGQSTELTAAFWKRFTTRSLTAPEVPGATALLAQLHAQGTPVVLLAQVHRRNLEAQLSVRGWRRYFAEVIAFEDFVVPKPHPHAYTEVLRTRGVLPECAMGVEHASVGLRAAQAAGLVTVHMGCANEALCREEADLHVADCTDLEIEDLSATA